MSKNTKALIALLLLAALICAALLCRQLLLPSASRDAKNITVTVTHKDGSIKEFFITTNSSNLRGALEEQSLIAGDSSGVTLFVTSVDGEEADSANEEWWCFTKDGEMLMTGVDDTLTADGEAYEITFTVGYDW